MRPKLSLVPDSAQLKVECKCNVRKTSVKICQGYLTIRVKNTNTFGRVAYKSLLLCRHVGQMRRVWPTNCIATFAYARAATKLCGRCEHCFGRGNDDRRNRAMFIGLPDLCGERYDRAGPSSGRANRMRSGVDGLLDLAPGAMSVLPQRD